jgi:hypothetical protein
MWTLQEGVEIVRSIQPALHDVLWHCSLGGGVLNNGFSMKDLDLFMAPFESEEDAASSAEVLALLAAWGPWEFIAGEYVAGPEAAILTCYEQKVKFHLPSGQRIDVFMAGRL